MTQDDLAETYRTIRAELAAYDEGLAQKPELVALTKCDALTPDLVADQRNQLHGLVDAPIIEISAVAGDGLQTLYDRLVATIAAADAGDKPRPPALIGAASAQPKSVGGKRMNIYVKQARRLGGQNRLIPPGARHGLGYRLVGRAGR